MHLPLLQVAYDRDNLPVPKSQNRLEEKALLAVIQALPKGVHPVILGGRGFARANFFAFLKTHGVDYFVRIDKGTCMTEADGHRWKLGEEGTRRGENRWSPLVRYALYHGRPTEILVNMAICWRLPPHQARNPRHQEPKEPWYLATSLGNAGSAIAWYQQRGWIEQSFIALSWLTLAALPEIGALQGWHAAVSQRGRAGVISLALALLDHLDNLPRACLPPTTLRSGYA